MLIIAPGLRDIYLSSLCIYHESFPFPSLSSITLNTAAFLLHISHLVFPHCTFPRISATPLSISHLSFIPYSFYLALSYFTLNTAAFLLDISHLVFPHCTFPRISATPLPLSHLSFVPFSFLPFPSLPYPFLPSFSSSPKPVIPFLLPPICISATPLPVSPLSFSQFSFLPFPSRPCPFPPSLSSSPTWHTFPHTSYLSFFPTFSTCQHCHLYVALPSASQTFSSCHSRSYVFRIPTYNCFN